MNHIQALLGHCWVFVPLCVFFLSSDIGLSLWPIFQFLTHFLTRKSPFAPSVPQAAVLSQSLSFVPAIYKQKLGSQ